MDARAKCKGPLGDKALEPGTREMKKAGRRSEDTSTWQRVYPV